MEIIQIAALIIPSVATGIVTWLSFKIKKREDTDKQRSETILLREKATNQALRALCRDRILQGYRYYKAHGGVSTFDLETMTKLYDAYHGLGGNGTITAIYDKICALPIKESD